MQCCAGSFKNRQRVPLVVAAAFPAPWSYQVESLHISYQLVLLHISYQLVSLHISYQPISLHVSYQLVSLHVSYQLVSLHIPNWRRIEQFNWGRIELFNNGFLLHVLLYTNKNNKNIECVRCWGPRFWVLRVRRRLEACSSEWVAFYYYYYY